MKRIITIVTALGIALVGCGGDDAASVTQTTGEASVDPSSDSATTVTEPTVAVSADADADAEADADADAISFKSRWPAEVSRGRRLPRRSRVEQGARRHQ